MAKHRSSPARWARRGIFVPPPALVLIASAAAAIVAGPAGAVPLTDAASTLIANCPGDSSTVTISAAGGLDCDVTRVVSGNTQIAVVAAQTAFGQMPSADVQANAQTIPNEFGSSFSVRARGVATAVYEVRLNEIDAPPHPIVDPFGRVPVAMTTRGSFSKTNFASSAQAQVTLAHGGIVDFHIRTSADEPSFDVTPTISMFPGVVYTVTVHAVCEAFAIGNTPGGASEGCQAVADPFFAFDQAAFDLLQGINAFTLSDFYALEFSPNVLAVSDIVRVSEPTALALFIVALAALGLTLQRRVGVQVPERPVDAL